MKDFKKLTIWQKGMDLVDRIYDLSLLFPSDEKFGIRTQLTRAAVSIPLNVSEGSARSSEKDYRRFLEMSLGSAFEVETLLIVVQRRKWIVDDLIGGLLKEIDEEQKMLAAFIKKLG